MQLIIGRTHGQTATHCHTKLVLLHNFYTMAPLSTAEKNRRKRERKKLEKEEQRKENELTKNQEGTKGEPKEVEIEYVAESVTVAADGMDDVLRRFQERSAVVTDGEDANQAESKKEDKSDDDEEEDQKPRSKRKLREILRPSVADLKRRVNRADLVEAHDVTANDPDFLIYLKGVPGTVPVPRHWGRKRKYLQGKRGFEKPPFTLPDFIIKTGITDIRDTVAEDEAGQKAKQKNRGRVAPKMGAMDVDYRTLHDAFFKYQTKPENLTSFGDLYYEGRELETRTKIKPGEELSPALREALGMITESSPPPWLINMQRYGPPPGYPTLRIPGLNAPLPNEHCQYGYHTGGWGKPPVDNYQRPLYGGDPFAKPGGAGQDGSTPDGGLVTSDGKTLLKGDWGALPTVDVDEGGEESSEEEEDSSDEEMEHSEGEEHEDDGSESVLPPPPKVAPLVGELRKARGDETPLVDAGPKQLYTVLEAQQVSGQEGNVFGSEFQYVLPGGATAIPEGAASVLSKAAPSGDSAKRKRKIDEDDDELGKNFKF
jgi:splicing factor 3B subunit 2